ncbi:MAG TPA: hypothetical protein VFZ66_27010 [Herpetosiphonaceae bacterium]
MITSHTNLLRQLHEYVDEYVDYLATCANTPASCAEVRDDIRKIIQELEALQAHPDQRSEAERLSQRVGDQIAHLRMLHAQMPARPVRPSQPRRTLTQAFQDYINTEVEYLARAGGGAQRTQINALLSDVIADLKALTLNPTDEQALVLAHDLEIKREQLKRLQRPWQQLLSREAGR